MLKEGKIAEKSNTLYIPTEFRKDLSNRKVKLIGTTGILLIFSHGLKYEQIQASLRLLNEELKLRLDWNDISNNSSTHQEEDSDVRNQESPNRRD